AAMTKSRITLAPDVPTVDEAGLLGLYVSSWFAVFAPGNTPKIIVATLNAAIAESLANSSLRERLAGLGQQICRRDQQTPEALAAWQKAEVEKWWPIIKAAGMKGE